MRKMILAGVLLLGGCASTAGFPPINGSSHANSKLAWDTYNMIRIYALAGSACDDLEAVQVSVLDKQADRETEGRIEAGSVRERWSTLACDGRQDFEVTFTPDGEGGAYFSVRKLDDSGEGHERQDAREES